MPPGLLAYWSSLWKLLAVNWAIYPAHVGNTLAQLDLTFAGL